MNAVRWDDGSKVSFQNINSCTSLNNNTYYYCVSGYATITNPMGSKVCNLKDVHYVAMDINRGGYTPNQCRYK